MMAAFSRHLVDAVSAIGREDGECVASVVGDASAFDVPLKVTHVASTRGEWPRGLQRHERAWPTGITRKDERDLDLGTADSRGLDGDRARWREELLWRRGQLELIVERRRKVRPCRLPLVLILVIAQATIHQGARSELDEAVVKGLADGVVEDVPRVAHGEGGEAHTVQKVGREGLVVNCLLEGARVGLWGVG